MLSFLEKATNTSCFFGGLPFHWDGKSNRITLPLNRKHVFRWSVAAVYEFFFTVFVLFRAISIRNEELDSVARLRVTSVGGFCILFGSVHVYYVFRSEQAAGLVNMFVRLFKQLEGIG